MFAAMLFDIDDAERWEYEIDGPTPNWVVRKDERPPTYHAAYTLEIPVARHKHARFAPIAKFRLLSMELGDHFGADPQYDMVMTKNPLNPPEGCSAPLDPQGTVHPRRTGRMGTGRRSASNQQTRTR